MPDTAAYTVTRSPSAPPRRAGRAWPVGETVSELSGAQVAAIEADPGYSVAPYSSMGVASAEKPAAGNPAGRGKSRSTRARKRTE
jgi:hypothetical protein